MSEKTTSPKVWRQAIAALAGVIITLIGLAAWYRTISHLWTISELGICFVPLLIGLAVGLGIRFCRADGTFGLASFAVVLVLLSGLAGSAFQLKIMFDHRLKIMAEATYDETLGYAKHTVPAEADDEALRRFMANNEVSVIGRLTPIDGDHRRHNYWEARNFVHLHWVASRNIILYGQVVLIKQFGKHPACLRSMFFWMMWFPQLPGMNR